MISYFKYFCLNVNIPYLDCTVTAISDAGNQNMQKHIQQMADYMMIKSGTLCQQFNHRIENKISTLVKADMIFDQKFTQPDFQATSFTPQKCVICNILLTN